MDLELTGKHAFVTGSSRGLGFAAARQLVREGCHVALNSRTPDELNQAVQELSRTGKGTACGVVGDVADVEQSAALVQEAAEKLGGLDLLVTNAGGPPAGAFGSFSEAEWQQAIQLSFLSHVRLIKAALPYLRQSASPSVLTITSYSVKQPIPNLVLSNSVRAATVGLTKSLALELGQEKIRFNSILPGWTKTERVLELMEARAQQNQTSLQEELEKQTADIPLQRMASPEEFGKAAAFLLSPAASYITGVMLPVEGGAHKGTC
jgi:3-oxoacyl-[acyl-carrier protein] reductase